MRDLLSSFLICGSQLDTCFLLSAHFVPTNMGRMLPQVVRMDGWQEVYQPTKAKIFYILK